MNKYTTNATDEQLLNYGFTNYHKPTLYYCKRVDWTKINGSDYGMTLNVSIDKRTRKVDVMVLDEAFCQPIDPFNFKNEEISKRIDAIIKDMVEKGIINEQI